MKQKINALGKACHIISLILTILIIVGGASCLITGAVLCFFPDSALSIETLGDAQVRVSGDLIDAIPSEAIDSIEEGIRKGTASVSIEGKQVFEFRQTAGGLLLRAGGKTSTITLRRLGVTLLVQALLIGALVYLFIMLTKLTKRLQTCETPFAPDVLKALTQFGISLIPYALLKPVAESFIGNFFASGNFDIDFRLDLSAVFVVLIFLLLIAIFRYGAQLQKEADETL